MSKESITARLDPARMRALEQQTQQLSVLIIQRAVREVLDLGNDLQILTNAAAQGDANARNALAFLMEKLDQARAAARGIYVPVGTTLPPAPNENGQPN